MAKQITKRINSRFTPTYIDGIPVYGLGSWLRQNAGTIGSLAGAGIGSIIPGVGTAIGASIGGSVGGIVQADDARSDAEELQEQRLQEQQKQINVSNILNGLQPQQQYDNVMGYGGNLSRAKDYGSKKKPYPSVRSGDFAGGHRSYPIPTRADAIDALRLAGLHGRNDVRAKVYRKYPGLKKADGGLMLMDNVYSGITEDNTNIYKNGGTHETNPIGGIPIGRNALVEEGEVRYKSDKYGDYIFSNRY